MKTYWLITTTHDNGDVRPLTFSTDLHPAEWMARYGKADSESGRHKQALLFAMQISEEQHKELEATGSFS